MGRISNLDIINLALGDAYDDRIPAGVKTNLADVADAILNYAPAKNALLNALYNKIALTLISSMEFNNPFSRFRGEPIAYGDTIEDIYVGIPDGYDYDASNTNPFGQNAPDVKALYETLNKQMQYKQTIHDAEFRRAMRTPYGLDSLVSKIITTLKTSSEYDDWLIGKEILSQEKCYGKVVMMGVRTGTPATDGKTLLNAIKDAGLGMRFPTTEYNQQGVLQVTPVSKQVLIICAEYKKEIDLDVLAGIYNLSKADITQSIIEVDRFNDATIGAVLVDEEFLRFHYALEDGGLIYNPQGLYTNHFWNSWAVCTARLFKNAVMFKFEDLTKSIKSVVVNSVNATELADASWVVELPASTTSISNGAIVVTCDTTGSSASVSPASYATLSAGDVKTSVITITDANSATKAYNLVIKVASA